MKKIVCTALILISAYACIVAQPNRDLEVSKKIKGTLRVSTTNSHFFTDASGKSILLTGSHTWENFQDHYSDADPSIFNWKEYLDMMQNNHHNFMRLWMYEQPQGQAWTTDKVYIDPMPYQRAGKETAFDGKPKFDLDKWNQAYFDRMRVRVIEAGQRGIYVSIMFFQGWSQNKLGLKDADPFLSHPYNKTNNINGIDALNSNQDEAGKPTLHSLGNKAVLQRQEAYVKKVIETVNGLDNVLYEVINEGGTTDWLYHIVNYVHNLEKGMPKQHPVGVGNRVAPVMHNKELWNSPADWVSPTWMPSGWSLPGSRFVDDYGGNPPEDNHGKVVILDTDHLWGNGGTSAWVWKSFCRGLNPVFMDPWHPLAGKLEPEKVDFLFITGGISKQQRNYPDWDPVRKNMGYILKYAEKMDLTTMFPHSELSSTTYCLANPSKEFLVFFPEGGQHTLDISAVEGELEVEWFIPSQNRTMKGVSTVKGGYYGVFEPPYTGEAVLYLKKTTDTKKM